MLNTLKSLMYSTMNAGAEGKMIKIRPKTLQAKDPDLPSLAQLGHDVIFIILELLHDSHPASIANVRLVCSRFRHLAAYVSARTLKLRLCDHHSTKASSTLRRIEENGLLTAVRRIEVLCANSSGLRRTCGDTNGHEASAFKKQRMILRATGQVTDDDEDCSEAVQYLRKVLPLMTGLRDLSWPSEDLSQATLDALSRQVRFHAKIFIFRPQINPPNLHIALINSQILYSLDVGHLYHQARDCIDLMRPLKKLILSTSNLRSLTLNIYQPKGGCVRYSKPREYCGFGFTNGEKLPALEHLNIDDYPFGTCHNPAEHNVPAFSVGYPENIDEKDYWAENFDWSRLKKLIIHRADIALSLMPKLTAVEEVSMGNVGDPDAMGRFYVAVASTLKTIRVPDLLCVPIQGITRHGPALRELVIHGIEDNRWGERAQLIVDALPKLLEACPLIETLRLDIPRSGDWPFSTLDLLASFPNLRNLTIWFALGTDESLSLPKVTFSAVKMLFTKFHARNPRLKTLQVYSGCHTEIVRGKRMSGYHWPKRNSSQFKCTLSARDDEAACGIFTCECPDLSADANRAVRGEKVERKDVSADEDFGIHHAQAEEDEAVNVARNGPKAFRESFRRQ